MQISMDRFGDLLFNFYEYMGRDKKPSRERIKILYKEIMEYSQDDIVEAFLYMKSSLDSVPFNIPKAIKAAVFSTNRSKPQRSESVTFGQYGSCDDCNGTGIFKILVYDLNKNRTEPIQCCSRCENWRLWFNEPPGDRISATELSAAGYKFKPYNRVLRISVRATKKGTTEDIKRLAGQALRSMS